MLTNFRKYRNFTRFQTKVLTKTTNLNTSQHLFSSTASGKLNSDELNSDELDRDEFDYAIGTMRTFFKKRGWKEVTMQHRPSILAACEDPWTVSSFVFDGVKWPLPQTSQMWLEHELLKNPDVEGIYTLSTSYRQEPNPIPGRHQTIFPMFEFEGKGELAHLRKLEKDLLVHLGFGEREKYKDTSYYEACMHLGVESIEAQEEKQLGDAFGPVIFLNHFPESTSPFWNMKRDRSAVRVQIDGEQCWKPGTIARKIDVILCGQETIGSAERATDKEEMREKFETISDGKYAQKLRDDYGEERVNHELDEFFSLDFIPRYGGGIGMHRMLRAMRMQGLFRCKPMYPFSIV